jgi:hypothetical protein
MLRVGRDGRESEGGRKREGGYEKGAEARGRCQRNWWQSGRQKRSFGLPSTAGGLEASQTEGVGVETRHESSPLVIENVVQG